jgi:hypothetical protein
LFFVFPEGKQWKKTAILLHVLALEAHTRGYVRKLSALANSVAEALSNLPAGPRGLCREFRVEVSTKQNRFKPALKPSGRKYRCTVFGSATVVPSCHCQVFGVNSE